MQLICGDCLEEMKKIPNKSVNLIITSPPYNMTKRKGGYADKIKRYDEYNDWKPENEYLDWQTKIFNQFNETLNDKGVILYNFSYSIENPSLPYKLVDRIIKKTNFTLVDTIVWKKKIGVPFPANKYRLSRIWEFIFVFVKKNQENGFNIYKDVKSISKKTNQKYYEVIYNYIEARNNDGTNNLNKATFSSEMVSKLLNIYANKKTLVLDPFMGTGTTGVACKENGINFIGIEISNKQYNYAKKRINNSESKGE